MTTIKELLQKFPPPKITEAEILLAHLLKKDRTFVISHGEQTVPNHTRVRFARLIARKNRGEPMAYLIGEQQFYGLNFKVDRRVLIPRPESEWLVEKSIEILRRDSDLNTIIDIGTGSGCIIISLLKNLPLDRQGQIIYYGTDSSAEALTVAKRNAKLHSISQIKFLHGNLLSPARRQLQHASSPTLLLANLPYLTTKDYNQTPLSVRRFEPKQALLAGHDGLKYYRCLVVQFARLPNAKFHCLWEIDPCHYKELIKLVKKYFPKTRTQINKDQHGLNRYLSLDFA